MFQRDIAEGLGEFDPVAVAEHGNARRSVGTKPASRVEGNPAGRTGVAFVPRWADEGF
jgi:hypothetical protein